MGGLVGRRPPTRPDLGHRRGLRNASRALQPGGWEPTAYLLSV